MNRRGFVGRLVGLLLSLVGIGAAKASAKISDGDDFERFRDAKMSFLKLKEQLDGWWQLRSPPLKRCWRPENVHFSDVHCGAMTCPLENINEGFRALIVADRCNYLIIASKREGGGTYLSCILVAIRAGDAGSIAAGELADGSCTMQTWLRIVRDIERVETTGLKHKQ